jgi:type II protein arginine methyltransferase
MWRQTDDRKVWYEWIVEVFALSDEPVSASTSTAVQEKGREKERDDGGVFDGRRKRGTRTKKTRIAMSELHSSAKEACLM